MISEILKINCPTVSTFIKQYRDHLWVLPQILKYLMATCLNTLGVTPSLRVLCCLLWLIKVTCSSVRLWFVLVPRFHANGFYMTYSLNVILVRALILCASSKESVYTFRSCCSCRVILCALTHLWTFSVQGLCAAFILEAGYWSVCSIWCVLQILVLGF